MRGLRKCYGAWYRPLVLLLCPGEDTTGFHELFDFCSVPTTVQVAKNICASANHQFKLGAFYSQHAQHTTAQLICHLESKPPPSQGLECLPTSQITLGADFRHDMLSVAAW